MLPKIDLNQALLRGAYSKSVAWMEHNGLPLSPLYAQVAQNRADLRLEIARKVEAAHGFGIYEIKGKKSPRPIFKQCGFDALIQRLGRADDWPQTTPKALPDQRQGRLQTNGQVASRIGAFAPSSKIGEGVESVRIKHWCRRMESRLCMAF